MGRSVCVAVLICRVADSLCVDVVKVAADNVRAIVAAKKGSQRVPNKER